MIIPQLNQVAKTPIQLTWRQGGAAPENMSKSWGGAAVVHGNTAYFSQDYSVYSYTPASDEWTTLPPCEYKHFGLAVVNNKVTTIGGCNRNRDTATLLSLEYQGMKWRELLPPMTKAKVRPATVTTLTNLVTAGGSGGSGYSIALSTVEILDTNTLQWSSASSLPQALGYPHMSLCGEHLYLSEDKKIYSCSVKELLKSTKSSKVWTKLADIPVPCGASLTTLRGQVLAIGGSVNPYAGTSTGAIRSYDGSTNSWSVIGEMPTPRILPLVAVLPCHELIAVGGEGYDYSTSNITNIASTK